MSDPPTAGERRRLLPYSHGSNRGRSSAAGGRIGRRKWPSTVRAVHVIEAEIHVARVLSVLLHGRPDAPAAGRRCSTVHHHVGDDFRPRCRGFFSVGRRQVGLTRGRARFRRGGSTRGSSSAPSLVMKTQSQTPRPIYQNDQKRVL